MRRFKLILAVRDLLWHWWCADRIRVSPAAGRLLRLNVGSLVTIDERDYEVVSRHVESCGMESVVTYDCVQNDRRGVLLVKSMGAVERGLSVCWTSEGPPTVLREADVQVWR